jgi:DNA-directed RNA polymerase subunit K/omega
MIHNLDFEKIMDRLGSKYEAVVRMSIIAKRLAENPPPDTILPDEKVTTAALRLYLHDEAAARQPEQE